MKRRLAIVAAIVATAILSSLATVVIAGPPPPATGTGVDLTRVKVIGTTTASTSTSSTTFVDVPDASRKINVSDGQALIVARFGADSNCIGTPAGAGCFVRILIGGVEADPGGSFFDRVPICSASSGTCTAEDGPEAHSMEGWRTVGPGTYEVKVQFATFTSSNLFVLARWTLEVDRLIV